MISRDFSWDGGRSGDRLSKRNICSNTVQNRNLLEWNALRSPLQSMTPFGELPCIAVYPDLSRTISINRFMNRLTLRTLFRTLPGMIALASVAVLPGFSGASAQTIPVPAPAPTIETQPSPVSPTSPIPNRSTDTPGFSQEDSRPDPRPLTEEPTISCPAGQFASKFPDVTPNDWAYEAVNRVASGPLRCFPTQS
ncbi:hypothetical protein H6F80_04495 [Leptolyngbya sp. FACHB-711]|nr:hypothetical protein [Leptolyngbya sp. FACHB-711]